MSTMHTPGPWRVCVHRPHRLLKIETKDRVICDGFGRGQRLDETEETANANLIAAAPEMLAELEACAHAIAVELPNVRAARRTETAKHLEQRLAAARAAIARAKGNA